MESPAAKFYIADMTDEIRQELASLRETVVAGFARADQERTSLGETMVAGFARADQELASLGGTMVAGFARADRYFELQQAQFVEFRGEVVAELSEIRQRLDVLTERVDRLEREVQGLRSEFHGFRDWTAREFADVRTELRELLRVSTAQSVEIAQLSIRVDRLERHWNGSSQL
ncbi:hypothetical protein BH23GEM9_BH23GEM9_08630 [soil metagenome]